jgi:hypothetical protein
LLCVDVPNAANVDHPLFYLKITLIVTSQILRSLSQTTMSSPVVDWECYFDTIVLLVCQTITLCIVTEHDIQIEDRIMRVPRALFNDSVVFQDMLTMPQADGVIADGVIADGSDDEHPLKLESVNVTDFKLFVRAAGARYATMFSIPSNSFTQSVYHRVFNTGTPDLDTHAWIAVLRLAWMWHMEKLQKDVIKRLGIQFDPDTAAYQLQLALKYKVEKWIIPALTKLVERQDTLSSLEIGHLGQELTAKIAKLREQHIIAAYEADREAMHKLVTDGPTLCPPGRCKCKIHARVKSILLEMGSWPLELQLSHAVLTLTKSLNLQEVQYEHSISESAMRWRRALNSSDDCQIGLYGWG